MTLQPYQFPSASIVSRRGFTVFYNRTGRRYSYPQSRSIYVSRSLTDYTAFTLNYLNIGDEYNISVKPYIRFSGCYYNNIYGEGSEVLSAETVEIGKIINRINSTCDEESLLHVFTV